MITETLKTKISYNCDVLVCGGGIAGISAALAAARNGAKVILIEKNYILGGLATAGLVTVYLPLCDGMGQQVSFGIAEELLRLSILMGDENEYPESWLDNNNSSKRTSQTERFRCRFNSNLFAILAEQLLLKEGVQILYGSYAVKIDKNNDKINAVIMENKSGRQAIKVKSVIDATGDCDIAYFADVPTKIYSQGNILAAWYYFLDKSGYSLKMLGCLDAPDDQKNDTENKEQVLIKQRFTGVGGQELSEMMQLSHAATMNDIKKRRESDPTIIPTSIATIPQIRMSRKIQGLYTLDEVEMHTYFDDSVGMVSDWRKRGPVYEVPFRTLITKEIKNLIVAGRCTSVTDSMWDIMRVIPCCAVTGQAAGTAAAITDDFSLVDISLLQDKLRKDGVILHEKDLK